MQFRRLGRTGLEVSTLSLGSGGPNQFGQARYVPRDQIFRLVRRALDLGINFFDTASTYEQSESMLGQALQGVPRDRYFLATKILPVIGHRVIDAGDARRQLERSLEKLRVNDIDLLQLHRVPPEFYEQIMNCLRPELERLRTQGKVRFFGVTESSNRDLQHRTLKRALQDDFFDTVMVAYDPARPCAEEEILPQALARDVGVIGMAAARHLVPRNTARRWKLFSRAIAAMIASPPRPAKLRVRLQGALATLRPGKVRHPVTIERSGTQGVLEFPGAAYTFALSHPAVATVLSGTTDINHLEQNVLAALAPPLTDQEIACLRRALG